MELLPRFKSSILWLDYKELYEKSFCRIHQVLFDRPCVYTMDNLLGLVIKGLVLFLNTMFLFSSS